MNYKVLWENNNLDFWWKFEKLNFLFKNNLKIPKTFVVNEKNIDFNNILKLYKKYINSEFYIVRSSCNVEDWWKLSYAWLFCSIFWKISENLLEKNIKKVTSSKNNENIILYEKYLLWKNIEKEINIIVQEYIFWDFSGVYFSDLDGKKLINIIFWWNKLLVDWVENSTNIYLNEKFEVIKIEIWFQKKYLWENYDIFECNKNIKVPQNILNIIIENMKKVEKLFDFWIDVEFTIKNNEFYFLQLRPITIW